VLSASDNLRSVGKAQFTFDLIAGTENNEFEIQNEFEPFQWQDLLKNLKFSFEIKC